MFDNNKGIRLRSFISVDCVGQKQTKLRKHKILVKKMKIEFTE